MTGGERRGDGVLLEARAVVKRYGQVAALRGADFTVRSGEIVALVGDNGAGKSTLVKILSGAVQPDDGELLVDGRPVSFGSPADAQRAGIATVFQDLALASDLNAAHNLFLGRERVRGGLLGRLGVLDKPAMAAETRGYLADLGVTLKAERLPVANFSGGQRQSIAVARATAWASKVILFDEPTAALGVVQTKNVHDCIRRVREERGVAVVLISHNMPEVLELADRVQVLRLGERVADVPTAEASVESLVTAMTGGQEQAA